MNRVSCALSVILFILAGWVGACGSQKQTQPHSSSHLKEIVQSIGRGDLIKEVEGLRVTGYGRLPDNRGVTAPRATLGVELISIPAPTVSSATVLDPCPSVPKPTPTSSDSEMRTALQQFTQCIQGLTSSYSLASEAVRYTRIFKKDSQVGFLSLLSDPELTDFFKAKSAPNEEIGLSGSLRTQFENADLTEYLALIARRRLTLTQLESQVYAAMNARKPLIQHYAKKFDRYAVLQAFAETAGDTEGKRTASAIHDALASLHSRVSIPKVLSQVSLVSLLHPYGFVAVMPDVGSEETPLDPYNESPFEKLTRAAGELAGPDSMVQMTLNQYRNLRDWKRGEIPGHSPLSRDAVRVVVMDTGIDYVKLPVLLTFLGNGKNGELASDDLIEGGKDPWVPAIDVLAHGTGTASTVLTLITKNAPEVMTDDKFDLAIWKTGSVRSLLAGPFGSWVHWAQDSSIAPSLIRKVEENAVKPKIVSVSLEFAFQYALQAANKPTIVRDAPWLWVMSAGNSGVDIEAPREGSANCFADVPAENRGDQKLLCVGALVEKPDPSGRSVLKIAGYSNFGKRVDVYTYESFTKLCPSGTSCATPAISAAAAMIAAKFPKLTPAQLKEVIVESAETMNLPVDGTDDDGEDVRTVKVFRPNEMMPQAYQRALKKL
jgi:hypothetical protein